MNKRLKGLLLVLVVLTFLTGCSTLAREYQEDLIVELGTEEKLIIKEWSLLLGSGAEVYYQRGSQKPVLLGQTGGADDGACPFSLGQYEITRNGNAVRVKWRFDTEHWRSETFLLPD